MRKIDSKNGSKNTPRNKIRRIEKALKTAKGIFADKLTIQLNKWKEKL